MINFQIKRCQWIHGGTQGAFCFAIYLKKSWGCLFISCCLFTSESGTLYPPVAWIQGVIADKQSEQLLYSHFSSVASSRRHGTSNVNCSWLDLQGTNGYVFLDVNLPPGCFSVCGFLVTCITWKFWFLSFSYRDSDSLSLGESSENSSADWSLKAINVEGKESPLGIQYN